MACPCTLLAVREVTPDDGIRAGRILRRWYRAKGLTKRVRREHVDQATGRVIYRTTTVRKKLFAANRGFVTVNDAPAMASQLARYLVGSEGVGHRRRRADRGSTFTETQVASPQWLSGARYFDGSETDPSGKDVACQPGQSVSTRCSFCGACSA